MIQESADQQAVNDKGVKTFTATLSEDQLKQVENRFVGKVIPLTALVSALNDAQRSLGHLAASAHAAGYWSLVVPVQQARALYFALVRVPGIQRELELEGDLKEMARVEAARAAAAAQQAVKVAEAMDAGEIKSAEEFFRAVAVGGNADAVLSALQAMSRSAPNTKGEYARMPNLRRPAIPGSLPSAEVFNLTVRPKGGVNLATGTVQVAVEKVLDNNERFRGFRGLLTLHCPRIEDQQLLIAAQLAEISVDVVIGGEIGILPGPGRPKNDMSVIGVTSKTTLWDIVCLLAKKQGVLFDARSE